MWNLPARNVHFRTALIALSGVLLIIAVLFLVNLNRLTHLNDANKSAVNQPQAIIIDNSPFVPVDQISPLIKSCLFTFFNSCAEPIDRKQSVPSPTPDPSVNTGPEYVAQNDLFDAISNMPNKALVNYQVPIDQTSVTKLFPDHQKDVTANGLQLSAPVVMSRVAINYDISPRVLLVLMELLHQGSGPLMSATTDFSTPYFSENPGFLTQLVTVASDLRSLKTKYILLQKDGQKLPTSLSFFDKDYTVSADANPETLALVEYLSQHTADKKVFERDIYAPSLPDTSGVEQTKNFLLLYHLIFTIDPR